VLTLDCPVCISACRVVMTDPDVLERLREVSGCGVVPRYKSPNGLGKKQLYRWDAGKYEKVKDVCLAIRPFMGERQTGQTDRLLQAMENEPPITNSEPVRRSSVTRKAKATV